MTTELPIEHRWELGGGPGCYTAKHVAEIPPERSDCLSDTMAPMEELGSVLGCVVPWTLCAMTRRGRERKMRRWERRHGFVGARVEPPPPLEAHGITIPAATPRDVSIRNPWGS